MQIRLTRHNVPADSQIQTKFRSVPVLQIEIIKLFAPTISTFGCYKSTNEMTPNLWQDYKIKIRVEIEFKFEKNYAELENSCIKLLNKDLSHGAIPVLQLATQFYS